MCAIKKNKILFRLLFYYLLPVVACSFYSTAISVFGVWGSRYVMMTFFLFFFFRPPTSFSLSFIIILLLASSSAVQLPPSSSSCLNFKMDGYNVDLRPSEFQGQRPPEQYVFDRSLTRNGEIHLLLSNIYNTQQKFHRILVEIGSL